ncbi:MAG: DUF2620 family protein [Chloroflexota bacterium]|nr:MAG: DUF2620 domain-containing protein [Chloroflexota bacterium]
MLTERDRIRVVVAGVDAPSMAAAVESAGGSLVQAAALGDMQAARLIKTGRADYYLGTCWSGGGGALAAATAILGTHQVAIVGTPGMPVKGEKVSRALADGCRAFGFPYEQTKTAVPTIMQAILEHRASSAADEESG